MALNEHIAELERIIRGYANESKRAFENLGNNLPGKEEFEVQLAGLDKEIQSARQKFDLEFSEHAKLAKAKVVEATSNVGFSFAFFSTAYMKRLFVCMLALCGSGYINALSSAAAGYRNPQIVITAPR